VSVLNLKLFMVENKTSPFTKDRYGGIEITDMALLPDTESEFESALKQWLSAWEQEGVRSV
jgi:hypothetical protein